jgi:hypothetical protein
MILWPRGRRDDAVVRVIDNALALRGRYQGMSAFSSLNRVSPTICPMTALLIEPRVMGYTPQRSSRGETAYLSIP